MDSLAAIRLFNKVVETGSFSEAGRQLGLAPSSVSRQVNSLEEELGARLLNRTTRKLNLTEAGSIYYDRTHRILAEIEEANRTVSELNESPRGTLKLNVPVVFGRRYIAPTLPEFLEKHPEVRVQLTVTDHYVDLIEDGSDLAIRIGAVSNQSFVVRKLLTMSRVLIASHDYLASHGEPRTPDELKDHNCITYKLHPGKAVWVLEGADGRCEIDIQGNIECNNAEAIRAAMVEGGGIALLPVWAIAREIQEEDVKVVLPEYRPSPAAAGDDVFAVYPYNRHLSAKVRAYIDFIAEKFKTHPDFTFSRDREAAQ